MSRPPGRSRLPREVPDCVPSGVYPIENLTMVSRGALFVEFLLFLLKPEIALNSTCTVFSHGTSRRVARMNDDNAESKFQRQTLPKTDNRARKHEEVTVGWPSPYTSSQMQPGQARSNEMPMSHNHVVEHGRTPMTDIPVIYSMLTTVSIASWNVEQMLVSSDPRRGEL